VRSRGLGVVFCGAVLAFAACSGSSGDSPDADAGRDGLSPSEKPDAQVDFASDIAPPDAGEMDDAGNANDDAPEDADAPSSPETSTDADADVDGRDADAGDADASGDADGGEAGAPATGCMIDLGVLGTDPGSWAVAVNDQGAVAAISNYIMGQTSRSTGFYFRDGKTDYLAPSRDMNNGCMFHPTPTPTCVPNIPPSSSPRAINAAGDVVGQAILQGFDGQYQWQAYNGPAAIWRNGQTLETMPDIPGTTQVPVPVLSVATAINGAGQVIGQTKTCSESCLTPSLRTRAFFWEPDLKRTQDLGSIGGPFYGSDFSPGQLGTGIAETIAWALNAHGQVVGESVTDGPISPGGPPRVVGPLHAFLWEAGTMKDLGTLGGTTSSARAIDDDGVIFGLSAIASGESHVFRWEKGAMKDLGLAPTGIGAMSPTGRIVGALTAGGSHAYVWEAGTTRDLGTLGGANSSANAMNAAGQVAGESTTANGQTHAFLWSDGVMRDLGTLGGVSSRALTVSPSGMMVAGASRTASGAEHAFLWTANSTCPTPPAPSDAGGQ
jgi:probable HAF family extracellular repeat protein